MRPPQVLWVLLVAVSMTLFETPCDATDYELLSVPYLEISPERKLPLLKDPADEIVALEASAEGAGLLPKRDEQTGTSDDASSVIRVLTNNASRFRTEALEIFRSLAFVPDTGNEVLTASFFGDLLFLYGGPLPIMVLRKEGDSPRYVYLSHAPFGGGAVLQENLSANSVFWFREDVGRVVSRLRIPVPRAPYLVLWDAEGDQSLYTQYNALEWTTDSLRIIGDTCALGATCTLDSSAVRCFQRHGRCQLSLLDPVSWKPIVLRTTIEVRYLGGQLEIGSVILTLMDAGVQGSGCLWCEPFQTLDEMKDHQEFGSCGANLQGVSGWRCLGEYESYLQESREKSLLYWQELVRWVDAGRLGTVVSTGPSLNGVLDFVRQNPGSSGEDYSMPKGLGGVDPISMIDTIHRTSN